MGRSKLGEVERFRHRVIAEFGPNLEHATPANVREFLDRLQSESHARKIGESIVLNETGKTYEEIVKDFFAKVLEMPHEKAIITLWIMALELSFAAIEGQLSEQLTNFFGDFDKETG